MSWQPEADDIARRRAFAHALGGEEAVAKHHAQGRLTVRERIEGGLSQSAANGARGYQAPWSGSPRHAMPDACC